MESLEHGSESDLMLMLLDFCANTSSVTKFNTFTHNTLDLGIRDHSLCRLVCTELADNQKWMSWILTIYLLNTEEFLGSVGASG